MTSSSSLTWYSNLLRSSHSIAPIGFSWTPTSMCYIIRWRMKVSTFGGWIGNRARFVGPVSRVASAALMILEQFTKTPGIDPLWMLNHFHFLDSGRNSNRPLTFSRYAGPGSHRYPVGFSGVSRLRWASLWGMPLTCLDLSRILMSLGNHWISSQNSPPRPRMSVTDGGVTMSEVITMGTR